MLGLLVNNHEKLFDFIHFHGKSTVDEYIGIILATFSEEEKNTNKCVTYSGDISDSDSEEEKEIYDDASHEDE
ncbi:hypothetical protein BpHYR1_019851 [Brachionus plicatilis]|uniref:Uncharacterized protein n=1 Tax=Brachionus plicatilis TaxID=10195 RepID=A0A3M7QPD6_BRAPC|nr:hypothetical protein BpHYR1_019851 [Brachionus plicatilis]